MAKKKKKVNKTQAIKDALARSPSGSPSEIAAQLAESGIKVSAAYVSTVKSDAKRKGGKAKKSKRGPTDDLVSLPNLLEAKKFAEKIGGVQEARTLLDALKKIESTAV